MLAFAFKIDDGPALVSEVADLAGFPLDVGYPAINKLWRRGYLREERRRFSLTQQGEELVAELDAARREGIEAYVDTLDPEERGRLRSVFVKAR